MVREMNTLELLIAFSRHYGADPELVNAGGGNTSAKEKDIMYVKCSGTALGAAGPDSFAKMDMKKLSLIPERKYPEGDREREAAFLTDMMAARCPGEENKRPSVETLLHAFFPQKFVLHLHPALVNGLTCSRGGETEARRLFGDDIVWIPACRPGYILAMELYEKFSAAEEKIDVVLLENHGVFFAADSVPELDRMLLSMTEKLTACIREFPETQYKPEKIGGGGPEPGYGAKLMKLWGGEHFRFNGSATARAFAASAEKAKDMMIPFIPDQVVYCGMGSQFIGDIGSVCGVSSRVAIVRGVGFYSFGKTEKEAENAMLLTEDSMKIAVYSRSFGGANHLSAELVDFLVHWEAESYRKSV